MPTFKVIQDLPDEQAQLIYFQSKKPAVPMVDQRDFVTKMIMRKGYFVNEDGTDAGHVIARVNVGEHPDYPTGKKGFTRGIEHMAGTVIKPAPEVEGCVVE